MMVAPRAHLALIGGGLATLAVDHPVISGLYLAGIGLVWAVLRLDTRPLPT
jgi:hypothetical protein